MADTLVTNRLFDAGRRSPPSRPSPWPCCRWRLGLACLSRPQVAGPGARAGARRPGGRGRLGKYRGPGGHGGAPSTGQAGGVKRRRRIAATRKAYARMDTDFLMPIPQLSFANNHNVSDFGAIHIRLA